MRRSRNLVGSIETLTALVAVDRCLRIIIARDIEGCVFGARPWRTLWVGGAARLVEPPFRPEFSVSCVCF
ncbi:hypothetical protein F2Q68_00015429 [Brassica cretica]|uniref:Uncharacterized protein n=1 Tax=Brassica cretica TaxID=69181 RepID=A0A8S9HEE5_BRACR|nr:hypothetical protein F2Q68_00015429 [Brassica cretica]